MTEPRALVDRRRRWVLGPLLVVGLWLLAPAAGSAQGAGRLAFIGVELDAETGQADRWLVDFLAQRVGVGFAREDLEYEQVIHRLVDWRKDEGFFVARITPYAYVVSELLGAAVEPLATYVNAATDRTTYHAYFVVNRKDFSAPPTLPDLLRFLAARKPRARFIFHSQFSTSSYFLPSLFFRAHKVFQMPESIGPLVAIAADRIADVGSSALVERVSRGETDLAAVWDGVKHKYEPGGAGYEPVGRHVYFVELPTALPNDLLICSANLDAGLKERLRQAIKSMGRDEINIGDFRTWQGITEATDARLALADLRQAARERVAPVTVEIQLAPGASPSPKTSELIDAAKQAVRLSGTEFVLYDEDFTATSITGGRSSPSTTARSSCTVRFPAPTWPSRRSS